MKKETRIALIMGERFRNFRVYMLTVFRGKMIEGMEFFKATNSFELSSALTSSRYYNEVRFFITSNDDDPFVNDEFYVRVAKPTILSHKLETITKTYGVSRDEARRILNALAKTTFLESIKFLESLFRKALSLLEELKYGENS